jgi:hypothetical protein
VHLQDAEAPTANQSGNAADAVVPHVNDALDLPLRPLRLVATLRR